MIDFPSPSAYPSVDLHRWSESGSFADDAVVITADRDIAAERADELWTSLEEALQTSTGRLVVADLSEAVIFDASSLDVLATVVRVSTRLRLDISAVMHLDSALDRYVRKFDLGGLLPIYASVTEALAHGA
jgi:anti-anti-sigma regulatory factor